MWGLYSSTGGYLQSTLLALNNKKTRSVLKMSARRQEGGGNTGDGETAMLPCAPWTRAQCPVVSVMSGEAGERNGENVVLRAFHARRVQAPYATTTGL